MIEPGKSTEVAVLLNYDQARSEGVELSTVRDRFQVVAIGIENPTKEDLLGLWNNPKEDALNKTVVKCKVFFFCVFCLFGERREALTRVVAGSLCGRKKSRP